MISIQFKQEKEPDFRKLITSYYQPNSLKEEDMPEPKTFAKCLVEMELINEIDFDKAIQALTLAKSQHKDFLAIS